MCTQCSPFNKGVVLTVCISAANLKIIYIMHEDIVTLVYEFAWTHIHILWHNIAETYFTKMQPKKTSTEWEQETTDSTRFHLLFH